MLLFLQHVPALLLVACGLLVALFLIFLSRMIAETRRALRDTSELSGILRQLMPAGPANRRDGLSLKEIEKVRGAIATRQRLLSTNVSHLWSDLESSLQPYSATGEGEGWFAMRPLSEVLTEEAVIDRSYHTAFHQAVPSLLTALGLTATFVAILFALEGLTVEVKGGAEIVEGIGTLINGLAGKFLSSVIALSLAVLFTLIEKKYCERRLQNAHADLLRQAREVIPELGMARILLDIQTLSARRTALLQGFYGEMAERTAALIRTEVVPLLAGAFARNLTGEVERRLAPVLDEVRVRAGELERIAERAALVPPPPVSVAVTEEPAPGNGEPA